MVRVVDDTIYLLTIEVDGVAVSDNALKTHFRATTRGGRPYQLSKYTPEAEAWMQQVAYATRVAIQNRPEGMPHPREWALPLMLDVTWRGQRIDPLNGFKCLLDALKLALEVDDRLFEFDGIRKARVKGRTPGGQPGVTIRLRPAEGDEVIRPRPKSITPLVASNRGVGALSNNLTPKSVSARSPRTKRAPDNTKPAEVNARRVV